MSGAHPLTGVPLQAKGLAVVSDPEKDKEMVKALLELRLKLDTLHANAFNRDDKFKYAIKVRIGGMAWQG